jgi:hypothetical protein
MLIVLSLHSQGKVETSFYLLTALAEEGDVLERRRRTALLPALMRRSRDVFGLLETILAAPQIGQHLEAILCCKYPSMPAWVLLRTFFTLIAGGKWAALKCAKVWLRLDLDAAGTCFLSPGTFLQKQVSAACHCLVY